MELVIPEPEWQLRIRRYEQLRSQLGDAVGAGIDAARATRDPSREALAQIIESYRSSRSAAGLRDVLDPWARTAQGWGFAGPNGQMFLNQLVSDSESSDIDELLHRTVQPPTDRSDALQKLQQLEEHVAKLRANGSSAAAGRVAPFLSWFWWAQTPETWPVMWSSVSSALVKLGFTPEQGSAARNYDIYEQHVRRLGKDFVETDFVLGAIEKSGEYGLDITTCDRLSFVGAANTRAAGNESFEQAKAHLDLLRQMSKPLGVAVRNQLAARLGVDIILGRPSVWWNSKADTLRRNLYVSWLPKTTTPSPSILLIADGDKIQVGLQASSLRSGQKGFLRRTFDLLEHEPPEGTAWMRFAGSQKEGQPLAEIPSEALLGRAFTIDDFATHEQAQTHIIETVEMLMPAIEKVWANESTPDEASRPANSASATTRTTTDASGVTSLREQFLVEEGYPNESDIRSQRTQRQWANLLQKAQIASTPLAELRRMYNGSTYGSPGPQSILNTTLSDEDPDVVDRFRTAVQFLLWGDGTAAERIDSVMDEQQYGLRGFKEGAIMKFLALAHPEEFLAVYPFSGAQGKAAMLQAFGLEVPAMSATLGARQVEASRALKQIVEPLFPEDPWGQSRFLYWLAGRAEQHDFAIGDLDVEVDDDPVGTASAELLLDRTFLDEIEQLLGEHRQLIFYGPPGTGKTYVAQRLAEALAPTDEQRMLVQFHPSTSYEDFFEGYRPLATGNDQIIYKLVSGPLRIMADRAAADLSKRPHILIIDEINRANLAKVLGELLYLLEYRDREIHPLYRPTEPFSLPENLWIIGTMNTADRSIATVDAAMRRRFHFIPFVPDDRADNPLSGLLNRWLEENEEPTEVADLVDGVNQMLKREMGGDHLLLGPSYFMSKGLDKAKLATIWNYRIEPLVDDLFFGDERAQRFRFDKVWAKFAFGEITEEGPLAPPADAGLDAGAE